MANLVGPIQLKGTIGNLSFFKTKDGKTVTRQKGGASREKFHSTKTMQRCRENSAEFTSASKVAGKIRRAFSNKAVFMSEGTYFNRMTGLLNAVVKTDRGGPRGGRRVLDGNVHLLEDFQWNKNLSLGAAINTEWSVLVDAEQGTMRLELESFVPLTCLKAPAEAKYYQIVVKGAVVGAGETGSAFVTSGIKRIDSMETGGLELQLELAPGKEEGMMVMGVGIIFFEDMMGVPLALRGGAFDILRVERVNGEGEGCSAEGVQAGRSRDDIFKEMMETLYTGFENELGARLGIYEVGKEGGVWEKVRRLKQALWVEKVERYRGG